MNLRNALLIIFVFFIILPASGFTDGQKEQEEANKGLYLSFSAGMQMSGIKNEDFIASNYSPLLTLYAGKWFTPLLALQLGYRGNYFNTISHERKRYYKYFSGEAVFNLNYLFSPQSKDQSLHVLLHAGSGYFYNHDYNRPNICAHLGLSGKYKLTKNLSAGINLSAIMGWDIYQGDEDILPAASIGIIYHLH
jgi:hypothetical protein